MNLRDQPGEQRQFWIGGEMVNAAPHGDDLSRLTVL